MQLELLPKQIDVWCLCYEFLQEKLLLEKCTPFISFDEQQRAQQFHSQKEKYRFLLTRALVRIILSYYQPVLPLQWVFATTHHGKPYIDNPEIKHNIFFNISHTEGLIVLGITNRNLGIDTENTQYRQSSLRVARRFFSSFEYNALLKTPKKLQNEHFFQYWTLKESYIKAKSFGLSIPLDKFSFDLRDAYKIKMYIAPELQDRGANWDFWLYTLHKKYTIALCAQGDGEGVSSICFRSIIPLIHEKKLIIYPTASSVHSHVLL